MNLLATVKTWKPEKGYGFAACDDGSPDVFIYHEVVSAAGIGNLERGDRVELETEVTSRGVRATKIRLVAN